MYFQSTVQSQKILGLLKGLSSIDAQVVCYDDQTLLLYVYVVGLHCV